MEEVEIHAQSFNHVAIWVGDMRKSADWYIDNLGMEEGNVSGNHIFLNLASGQVLALFQASDRRMIGGGVHHLALNLRPDQKQRALDILHQRNITLVKRGPNLSFEDRDGYWIHFS